MTKDLSNNFIVIQGWMRTKLDLKGNELMVYAIVYGFSQTEDNSFTGSANYIADWIGSTRKTVYNALGSLVDKGLILKTDRIVNGTNFPIYDANPDFLPRENFTQGMEANSAASFSEGGKNFPRGWEKSTHNNIEDKYRNKSTIPSIEEIQTYCLERKNNINPIEFYNYYAQRGWTVGKANVPMKDWKASVRYWESTRKKNNFNSNDCVAMGDNNPDLDI